MSYPKIVVTPPGPKAKKIVERDARYISPSFGRAYPLVVKKAEGCIVTDVDGNEFIDMNSGLAVTNVGHSNPKVLKAIHEQADKFLSYSYTDFFYENYIDLGEQLHEIVPGKYEKKFFYCNSGAEANEATIKVARWHTKRPGILAYISSFHGRTMGAVSLTASKPAQRRYFSPFIPGVEHIFYPYCYRCPFHLECPSCNFYCIDYIEEYLFNKYVPPEDVGLLIAEPIQGEGGYVVPPKEYFPKLKKMLDKYGILFAVDEVQSGMGRTGKWFAIENFGVVPDILTIAKGIAAGLPLGVMASRADLQDWTPGSHASTFGGNPVACAAAIAVINEIKEHKMLDNAKKQGNHIMKRLNEIKQIHPMVGDVRGIGLMCGVELIKDQKTKEPAKQETEDVMMDCFRKGIALVNCGQSVIRLMPPLIITQELVDKSLDQLEMSIGEVEKSKSIH